MELRKKQFKYKGQAIEELQKLDVREFSKIVKSGNRRNILRNFQKHEEFIALAKKRIENKKQIRTHIRDLVITPQLVGMRLNIYNGNKFVPVDITGDMLGHKFGEFAPTRAKIMHSKSGVGATKGSKVISKK